MAKAPENTLAALRLALQEGAEGFEFDVRALGDGTAVLLHDDTLDRTTNASGPLAECGRHALAEIDAGGSFSKEFRGERIPLLEDVLSEFIEHAYLAIEMKEVLPDAVFDQIAAAYSASLAGQVIIGSFDAKAVERARDRLPAVPRVLILPLDKELPPQELVQYLGLSGLFLRHESIREETVIDCRRLGLMLFAYPVNDPQRALELASLGVEGLISDDPGALRAVLPR